MWSRAFMSADSLVRALLSYLINLACEENIEWSHDPWFRMVYQLLHVYHTCRVPLQLRACSGLPSSCITLYAPLAVRC